MAARDDLTEAFMAAAADLSGWIDSIGTVLAAGSAEMVKTGDAVMSTTIDLGRLRPGQGFAIKGDADFDHAGRSVSGAGDVNGDGFADFIIGAEGNDAGGDGAGAAYVIFGKAGGLGEIDLAALAPPDGLVIRGGTTFDRAGVSVSSAGDVNDDGFADLIVGAEGEDAGGVSAGAAYVIFGKANGFGEIDLGALAAADGFVIRGDSAYDNAGSSVSSAGDINGDGFADLIVGADGNDAGGVSAGAAYVVFGKSSGFMTIDLAALAAADGFVIRGGAASDVVGRSVSSAGDVNDDGFADLILGALGADGGGNEAGAAYVIFGKADGFGAIDLGALAPADGFVIQGAGAKDYAGSSVSSAGDVNGDGFADLIVGAFGVDRYNEGAAYVIFGKADGFGAIDLGALATADGFVIRNDFPYSRTRCSVSSAGDVNGDGFDDLIVGAFANGAYTGAAYVIFGKAGGFGRIELTELASADGFIIRGADGNDLAGNSVSSAGDVDGDGFADLIVGAENNNAGGFDAGAAYVIYGSAPTESVTRIGSVIGQTIRGGSDDDMLGGRAGDDLLIGAGGGDRLTGGAGGDRLVGRSGDDTLSGGGGTDRISGGSGRDIMAGGHRSDQFRFDEGETGATAEDADTVSDFSQAQGDLIDLSAIDAITGTPVSDAFTFIGTSAFSGTASELRYRFSGADTLVSGDTDGDKAADFVIRLTGNIALAASDFMLVSDHPAVTTDDPIMAQPLHAFEHEAIVTAEPMMFRFMAGMCPATMVDLM